MGAVPDPTQAWTAYNDALQSSPLLVKSLTASVVLGAADLVGQSLEDAKSGDKTDLDVARTVRFAFLAWYYRHRGIISTIKSWMGPFHLLPSLGRLPLPLKL